MMIHRRKLGSAHTPCIGLEIKGGGQEGKTSKTSFKQRSAVRKTNASKTKCF